MHRRGPAFAILLGILFMNTQETVTSLIDAWKLMIGRLPGGRIEHDGGLATIFGHVPMPFLNLSAIDRFLVEEAELRAVLQLAKARAASCPYGSILSLAEGWAPANWQQTIADEGLAYVMNLTGMATNRMLPPRRPAPALELRRIADVATATDLALINGHAYGMPQEMVHCICNMDLWRDDSFGYVGYVEGKAVTAAAAFPVAGTVYVALVATLPDLHGKGYAEAVMRHAAEQAQAAMGFERIVLHASDMGRPVYAAMGFEGTTRVAIIGPQH